MTSFLNQFGKYILMAIIALISFLSGSVTDPGQAVQILLDKDTAIKQAIEIIQETPAAEIKEAMKAAE